jgi:mRNA-degrading endonuclease YafQ of YafQ-DinJ toxin-antitoxin module
MLDFYFINQFKKDLKLNDVLLLYEVDENKVTFSRLGTHSDLF